ncbi:MAG: hypothetical protein R3C05_07420 [Pirellulaceae bacterium]
MKPGSMNMRLYLTFVGLLFLLALTIGASFLLGGVVALCVGLAIATLKMLLIATVFMELLHSRTATRIVACGGVFWLFVFLMLLMSDYGTRGLREPMPHGLYRAPSEDPSSRSSSRRTSSPSVRLLEVSRRIDTRDGGEQ